MGERAPWGDASRLVAHHRLLIVNNPLRGSDPILEFPRLFVLRISTPHCPSDQRRPVPNHGKLPEISGENGQVH